MISVSNKFLTWDLASSEICRDVDPLMEGLMLGLAVSPDYRQAVAHTSNNQVIVLDIMLGQHRVLNNPLDPPDDILGKSRVKTCAEIKRTLNVKQEWFSTFPTNSNWNL